MNEEKEHAQLPAKSTEAALPAAVPTEALLDQVRAIQTVMHQVMRDGEHYGIIPGCGTKPTLLKPGAEKLCFTFRLRPIIDPAKDIQTTDLGRGHREYRVICHILNQAGDELATGIGSCSTMEGKYRYRSDNTGRPVPKAYWDSRDSSLLGGPKFKARKIDGQWMIVGQVEHDNPADHYNTCLKMAKKRATVDGILSATAASDMFTQDVEDLATGMAAEMTETRQPEQPKTVPADQPAQQNNHNALWEYQSDERIDAIINELGFDPFGAEHRMIKKYRGRPYIDVPTKALQWAIDHSDNRKTQEECRATLAVIEAINKLSTAGEPPIKTEEQPVNGTVADKDLPF